MKLPHEVERLGDALRTEVERELLEDLNEYLQGSHADRLSIDWTDAQQEGHCTHYQGRTLESLSDLRVRDQTGNVVARGWMDFVHGTEPMTKIRSERAEDVAAIRVVNERAFGDQTEARLVATLRKANKATVSLVAEQDGQVVGHILFSPVTVSDAPAEIRCLGLAPMSVLPEFQNRGIGSQLVRGGVAACQEAGYDIIVVLGHVDYYPRFGFARAKDFGLGNEYEAADAFMVLELREGALKRISGLVKFAPEFHEAGC